MKVNAENSFFGRTETEYIGFWVSNNEVRPLSAKLYAIKAINFTTKVRNIISFVVIINYYRYTWRKHAHTLSPLTKLCSTNVKFKWSDTENNDFIAMKKIVGCYFLLLNPNFSKIFITHTDASKTQMGGGGVISKNGKPVALYSHKLTLALIDYTTTER